MPGGAIMNTGHVRAAALAAAVIMMLAGCAAAHRDAGLAALTKPGESERHGRRHTLSRPGRPVHRAG